MNYDWLATLAFIGILVPVSVLGRYFAFKVPALSEMRDLNREADKRKLGRKRFREAVKKNNKVGLLTNLVFFIAIMPFCINLDPRPIWRHLVDFVAILMVFDCFYYFTHRFLFHGKVLRKVHALHHQARETTHIDALFVHPLETFIGLMLFLGTIPLLGYLTGGPLNAISVALATVVFTQQNTINHTFVHLPYFPFKTINYITSVHAAHHVDMNQGNYATLTMLYDWIFGTYEQPVDRTTP